MKTGSKGTYFTATYEFIISTVGEWPQCFNCMNNKSEFIAKLNEKLRLPKMISISNLWQGYENYLDNTVNISLYGEGLPAWAEREEGERLKRCNLLYKKEQVDGDIFLHCELIPI